MDPLAQFAPISLEDLTVQAALLQRFDTKYIVPLQRIEDVYAALSDSTLILENDGMRATSYVTAYFDSEDLHTYFDHLKKRRKRFKIRTRYYAESTDGFLEIKIQMPRGQTRKVRWPLDVSQSGSELSDEHRELLNEALQSSSYQPLSHQYQQTLTTTFSRTTLFDPPHLSASPLILTYWHRQMVPQLNLATDTQLLRSSPQRRWVKPIEFLPVSEFALSALVNTALP